MGCFGSETWFENRTYVGGNEERGTAWPSRPRSRRSAILRARCGDADGHGFLFDDLVPDARNAFPSGDLVAGGCERACADEGAKLCGCADEACTGAMGDDQPHHRRWAVYRMPDPPSTNRGLPAPDEEECGDAWTRQDEAQARRRSLRGRRRRCLPIWFFGRRGGSPGNSNI